LLVVLAALAGLACAGIIGVQWTAYRARRAADRIVAALAEQGLYVEPMPARNTPQTAEDPAPATESAGIEPPPEEIPFDSFALQKTAPSDISDYTEYPYSTELPAWETMSEAMRVAMRQYLADNQETLGNLHGHSLRWHVANTKEFSFENPELTEARFWMLAEAIRLLQIQAHVALADRDGETAAAALDVGLLLVKPSVRFASVTRSYREQRLFQSMAYSVRDAIISGALKSESLERLQQVFASVRTESILPRELQRQLNWGIELFGKPELMELYPPTPVDRFFPGFDKLIVSAKQRSGLIDIERQQFLRDVHQISGCLDKPAIQRFQLLKQMIDKLFQRQGYFRWSYVDLTRTAIGLFKEDAETRAQVAFATTALALERYRLEQGSLPDSLEALTPDYLLAIPNDPFDDAPLRYMLQEDGFILYGVGVDGVDNQGKGMDENAHYWTWDNINDVAFAVQYPHNTSSDSAESEGQPDPAGGAREN
jgi:hypothetical protein